MPDPATNVIFTASLTTVCSGEAVKHECVTQLKSVTPHYNASTWPITVCWHIRFHWLWIWQLVASLKTLRKKNVVPNLTQSPRYKRVYFWNVGSHQDVDQVEICNSFQAFNCNWLSLPDKVASKVMYANRFSIKYEHKHKNKINVKKDLMPQCQCIWLYL